ncbi:MAG TPA: histidine--tRNA ligase [Sphingomicrobium sp.]|nr:histidine--tRNA ligase [Sphingomicrobium sp.]
MSTLQPVRGTQSLLGEDADRLAAVVAAFDRVRKLFGFKRVEIPVIEDTAVFARSIGETTDIVSKEMYTFEDRGGDSITLRPEFTAGIARAYISEGWQQHAPLKVATHGPAFRYERPQKGRFRQFHQLDAEIIGAAEPSADIEAIAFAAQLIAELGLADRSTLHLNTLGDPATRAAWRDSLHAHFTRHKAALGDESRARLDRNPLRILDSKAHQDWPIVDGAPGIDEHLTSEAADFFAEVTAGLDSAGIAWTRAPRLVRGLDYYRHTAFEFVTEELGAQSQLLGGGRYDGLIEALGGPPTPAVGWAAGIERLAMMIEAPVREAPLIGVVPNIPEFGLEADRITEHLRGKGVAVYRAYRGNAKRQAEVARKNGADAILFIRNLNYTRESLNLSVTPGSRYDDTDLDFRVLQRLPAEYDQLSSLPKEQ